MDRKQISAKEENLIDKNENFCCQVCSLLINVIVSCKHCDNIYCSDCPKKWKKSCPMCRNEDWMNHQNGALQRMLNKVEFKCPFCQDKFRMENAEYHRDNCEKFLIKCPTRCGEVELRTEQELRDHLKNGCEKSELMSEIIKSDDQSSDQERKVEKKQVQIVTSENYTKLEENQFQCQSCTMINKIDLIDLLTAKCEICQTLDPKIFERINQNIVKICQEGPQIQNQQQLDAFRKQKEPIKLLAGESASNFNPLFTPNQRKLMIIQERTSQYLMPYGSQFRQQNFPQPSFQVMPQNSNPFEQFQRMTKFYRQNLARQQERSSIDEIEESVQEIHEIRAKPKRTDRRSLRCNNKR